MRKAKAIYSELDTVRESAIITCVVAETQRPVEEGESYNSGKKREGSKYALNGGCWNGEHIGSLTRRGDPM